VLDAYHGRIQKGRYPPAFLFLEVEPREVDVNVHPAKREVRFRNDGDVRRFVLGAISETLAGLREAPQSGGKGGVDGSKALESGASPKPAPRPAIRPPEHKPMATTAGSASPKGQVPDPSRTEPKPEREESRSDWQLIRLLQNRYALFKGPRGLVLLHLRHADQRVRFERIQKSFSHAEPSSQGLLIPEPLELEPMATATLEQHLGLLNRHGFHIEAFGRNFYRVEAVPTWLDPSAAVAFLRDTIDVLRQRGGSRSDDELIWQTVARLAAEGSYRQNDSMNEEAARQLAIDLLRCEIPHTSPAGRPTFREMTWAEFERHFEP
jgi:DNA mismatch repair protein MutL